MTARAIIATVIAIAAIIAIGVLVTRPPSAPCPPGQSWHYVSTYWGSKYYHWVCR